MGSLSSTFRGAILGLAAFAAFATHDALVKYLGGNYSAFQIVFFSVLFGFPMVTFLQLNDRTEANLIPKHPGWAVARTISVMITAVAAFYAFSQIPLAQVYALLFAAPLLITVMAIPMLGEKVGLHRAAAVVVGLIGVLIVLRPGATDLTLGHAAALLAAISGAFASVVVRKIGRNERPVVLILYPMMANVILMGALMPLVYEPMPALDLGALALIALLALLGTSGLIFAYRHAPAVIVAPMQYSQILWATLFGVLFFDETLTTATVIGTGIIIASGLYIVLREGRGGTSTTTPVLRTRSRAATPGAPRVAPFLPDDRRGGSERET